MYIVELKLLLFFKDRIIKWFAITFMSFKQKIGFSSDKNSFVLLFNEKAWFFPLFPSSWWLIMTTRFFENKIIIYIFKSKRISFKFLYAKFYSFSLLSYWKEALFKIFLSFFETFCCLYLGIFWNLYLNVNKIYYYECYYFIIGCI